jgi:hypothetical protein
VLGIIAAHGPFACFGTREHANANLIILRVLEFKPALQEVTCRVIKRVIEVDVKLMSMTGESTISG